MGSDKDMDDLSEYGVDTSRYKQAGGRVYHLCTTCGTQDAILGASASVLAGFMGLFMVKAERRRRLFLRTGERPGTGPVAVRELGLLLTLLGGAALLTGRDIYILDYIPLWAAAIVFLPVGLACLLGSRNAVVLGAIHSLERKLEESGLSTQRTNRSIICTQCKGSNAAGAVSCRVCGSMIQNES
jgi:ribosomal protein L40E